MLLYAVDGLEPAERAEMQRLVDAGDAAAMEALREANEVLAQLPEALPPVEPSRESRDRLMQAIEASAPSSPGVIGSVASSGGASSASSSGGGGAGRWLAIAAGLLIGAGIGAAAVYAPMSGRLAEDRSSLEALRSTVDDQSELIDRQQEALSTQRRLIESQQAELSDQADLIENQQRRLQEQEVTLALASTPGVRSAELAGTEDQAEARGVLFWDDRSGELSFLARNLRPLDTERDYELWFVTESGSAKSLGTFELNESGGVRFVSRIDAVPTDVRLAAVSVEPRGGSPEAGPTGPVVMASSAN